MVLLRPVLEAENLLVGISAISLCAGLNLGADSGTATVFFS